VSVSEFYGLSGIAFTAPADHPIQARCLALAYKAERCVMGDLTLKTQGNISINKWLAIELQPQYVDGIIIYKYTHNDKDSNNNNPNQPRA